MPKICLSALAVAGAFLSLNSFAQYADSVVAYTPGTGVSAGYTNPATALGEPARNTTGAYGGPVTPFATAWQTNLVVSVGAGGSLTLRFNTPIRDDPGHPYGIDFIIFGNSGFTITNGNYSGGGITDGSLFGHNTGATRVWVSADGTNFYVLNPLLAPVVDGLFPTESSGNYFQPVNPALRGPDFAGQDLSGIRALYAGAGGGAGFDLAWAQDTDGQSVSLPAARFVRIEVLSGKSEIDAVTALPQQTTVEDFADDPSARGWRVFGNPSLFRWNATNQNLEATWDSSQPNTYFRVPLGTILNRQDDFSIAFDLCLRDLAAGFDPERPWTFPLALGLQNSADAASASFQRSTGGSSPNLVEFNFFPDVGFDPTVWPAIWSTNSVLTYRDSSDYTKVDLLIGVTMRITMSYTASNATLATTILTNGTPVAAINSVTLVPSFTDFRVDMFAIESYFESRPPGSLAGSLLAHGVVDNVTITVPPPPVQLLRGAMTAGQWQTTFLSRTNWDYALEASQDFQSWSEVSGRAAGTGGPLGLQDTNAASFNARFYRVKAQRSN